MSTIGSVGSTTGTTGVYGVQAGAAAAANVDGDDASLLPTPVALGGSTITQLAALMTQCDEQDQVNSTNVENAANKAAAADDAARVQAMEDKASQDVGQALASGITEAVGGGLAIAGALVPSGGATAPSSGNAAAAAAPVADSGSRGLAGVLNGGAKLMPALGTIFAAPYKANADGDDAKAAKDQAASDADVRAYNVAQAEAQSAADTISKVEETLQGIMQIQEQTNVKAAGG